MSIVFRRPMLAAPLLPPDVEHTDERILEAMQRLRYPVLASLKMDGVRALRLSGSLLSRTLKPIPNKSIRDRSLVMPGGFDMELWSPELDYNDIQSIIMSHEHPDSDKIQFHILDWYQEGITYSNRIEHIISLCAYPNSDLLKYVKPVPMEWITSPQMLLHAFWMMEANHGEGICFRTPNSPYKFGRSTLKEQYLVKLCRYVTDEAVIIDFVEQMENASSTKSSRVGLTERHKYKHKQYPKDTLGSLFVRNTAGQVFNVGTGFTDKQRKEIWMNQDKYLGRTIVYRCKKHGEKILPRCPSFKGWRNKLDIV